jgi:hypothetical protein
MPLAEDNDMVKTIPSDRTDEPLRMSVLPWRSWCDRPVPNAHRANATDKDIANPDRERYSAAPVASRMPRRVDAQSIGRSDARSRPATESYGGNAAGPEIHTTAGTRSWGPRTNPSTRCRPRDFEETRRDGADVRLQRRLSDIERTALPGRFLMRLGRYAGQGSGVSVLPSRVLQAFAALIKAYPQSYRHREHRFFLRTVVRRQQSCRNSVAVIVSYAFSGTGGTNDHRLRQLGSWLRGRATWLRPRMSGKS